MRRPPWLTTAVCSAAAACALAAAVQLSAGRSGEEDRPTEALVPERPVQVAAARTSLAEAAASTAAVTATAPAWRTPPPESQDPDDQLAVDSYQRLVVNEALLATFNHYLLKQAGPGDRAELLAYLKQRLPAPAFDEAQRLADGYIAYMHVHDTQLAAQWSGTAPKDLASISTWIAQREQLRQSMLGTEATQAWFQNEDSRLRQALAELAQRQQGQQEQAGEAPVPHWDSAAEEARHVQYLQGLLSEATRPLRPGTH